jgi:glycosyltransferase involved in cell wall biosynthesis
MVCDKRGTTNSILGETMKLSIIIPVLNSHEIVRRQIEHFKKMDLPDDVEIIIVDDGSDPPLEGEGVDIIQTNDTRPWTQPKARNIGASHARGDVLLFTDIDHVIDKRAIEFGRQFKYDYGRFYRELGILDEDGNLTQAPEALIDWGLDKNKAYGNLHIGCHVMSMYIRAEIFKEIGGFREKLTKYPTHDDGDMKRKLNRNGFVKCPDDERPTIYMIPNGRFTGNKNDNPNGYFHDLCR